MYFKIVAFDSYYLASYIVAFGKELLTFPVTSVFSERRALLTRLLPNKVTVSQLVKKIPRVYLVMEPEGSLPHSQGHATCPYPEPDQSSPYRSIPLIKDPL